MASHTKKCPHCKNLPLFDYYLVDDYFTSEELDLIWTDIDEAIENNWFEGNSKEHNGTAINTKTKKYLAERYLFWPAKYKNIRETNLAEISFKVFQGHTKKYSETCFAALNSLETRQSHFLVSCYLNGGYYKAHRDNGITTALYWLSRDGFEFEGGDLFFPEINEWVRFKHNRMVMFPSKALHAVSPVIMDENAKLQSGRFCITQFME